MKYIDEDEKEAALFTMKKGETEGFLLIAQASRDRHEWSVSIPCLVDGVALEIPVEGDVLVTVGPEGVPQYFWVQGTGWLSS